MTLPDAGGTVMSCSVVAMMMWLAVSAECERAGQSVQIHAGQGQLDRGPDRLPRRVEGGETAG